MRLQLPLPGSDATNVNANGSGPGAAQAADGLPPESLLAAFVTVQAVELSGLCQAFDLLNGRAVVPVSLRQRQNLNQNFSNSQSESLTSHDSQWWDS